MTDLTPAEQQLLLEIRRRKTELLHEIQASLVLISLSLSFSLSLSVFIIFFPSFLFVRFTSVVYKRRRHKIWPSLIGAGRIHTRNHQLPRSIILEPGRDVTSSGRLAFIAALPFDKSEPWCRERPVDGISAAFPSISLSLSLSLSLPVQLTHFVIIVIIVKFDSGRRLAVFSFLFV